MKVLLSVAVLQLLLASSLSAAEGVESRLPFRVPSGLATRLDYYEEWEPWGPCSRTCGTGVATRTRQCVTHREDGRGNCVGPSKEYRPCNTQECPFGSRDFREQQCSEFDRTDFKGKGYTWLPYYGAPNPCELNCIPSGDNFFFQHRRTVVDGTPCYPGRRDICVEGVCKRLGCDNVLESSREEDPCLQCGGNGQSCFLVRNVLSARDLPSGHHEVVIIPAGATTLRIREMAANRNYLAIKNSHGQYYLNGHGVIDYTRAIPVAGTTLYYQRRVDSDMVPETIVARGPTTEQLVIELIVQESNPGVEYEYYLPHSSKKVAYRWRSDPWSKCSRECGPGYQSRRVYCSSNNKVVPDHLCANVARPLSNQTCELRECPPTYTFDIGPWGACSVSCGEGVQTRRVLCISHDGAGRRAVEYSFCTPIASVPAQQQACVMQQCEDYTAEHLTAYRPKPTEDHGVSTAVYDSYGAVHRPHCSQSYYGCCSDGYTPAKGHYGEGCPTDTCARTRYGCCPDGVTTVRGPSREGCVEKTSHTPERSPPQAESMGKCHSSTYGCCYDRVSPASGSHGEGCQKPPSNVLQIACSLPSTPGPCTNWLSRYYYDPVSGKCSHFWYGGCHGNSNNFPTREECQRECESMGEIHASAIPVPSPAHHTRRVPVIRQDPKRRHSVYLVRARNHRKQGSAGYHARG